MCLSLSKLKVSLTLFAYASFQLTGFLPRMSRCCEKNKFNVDKYWLRLLLIAIICWVLHKITHPSRSRKLNTGFSSLVFFFFYISLPLSFLLSLASFSLFFLLISLYISLSLSLSFTLSLSPSLYIFSPSLSIFLSLSINTSLSLAFYLQEQARKITIGMFKKKNQFETPALMSLIL